mmetsp:Transcript_42015/g.48729  ORF Transcript_42015/g.48729 Transcript_42015/m.48729 type:complete len:107 (-) Transcript_42015:73-393(-)
MEENMSEAELRKLMLARPIVQETDMIEEMRQDTQDTIAASIDSNNTQTGTNIEAATKQIKETLDKKYGPSWHCIMGEGFAFDVSAQKTSYMFMFYNGNLAILVYKS